ncbi:DUF2797 domain-containing protein [Actinoallomurus sp. CA-150999]|uniref:DUF2797 domain-containing protein n=1 Tax=Actinoallomurus sp. CA-150999 TaxID=3239887 RepID=UPI003D8C4577
MTDQPSAWRSTGLHWESAVPTLTAAAHKANGLVLADRVYARPVTVGQRIGWALTGPRRCIGVWNGTRRIACPTATPVPDNGTDAQCPACAAGDRGRALARDATLGDDHRTYVLYLAWFGTKLLKVGLTAADRGRDRLLEQGAITATLLGTGPYTAVRRAERAIAASGLAAERISGRAKADAWWALPAGEERARQVRHARTAVLTAPLPPDIASCDPQILDQATDFGLTEPVPDSYAELKAVIGSAVLAGTVRAVIGRRLVLQTPTGAILADMRRIAGWQLTPTTTDLSTGLDLAPRNRPRDTDEDQPSLF